jgi:unsaturated chondroitin disaccharide hydrolase
VLERAFAVCVAKTRGNIVRLANEPKSCAWAEDGNYFAFPEGFYDIGNWTSSFFTGMALLAWQATEDEHFLQQTLRLAPAYRTKVFEGKLDTHHDLGFLYTLYSVALSELAGDKEHRDVGIRAARVLAERFNPTGRFIRAWGRMDSDDFRNMAIIDCLMNLPLLYWAARQTHDESLFRIAVEHADTVLKCFVRADSSVCHAFRFDLKTGVPLGADNACGNSVDSYWARGASWAMYGFALSYRHTGERRFLDAAVRTTRRFLAQLDGEGIPVWDFRLPAGAPVIRDASAAAIAVCALQELASHGVADADLAQARSRLLLRACQDDYLDSNPGCPGVLRMGYGNRAAYSSWGDYFLMEALSRELNYGASWW